MTNQLQTRITKDLLASTLKEQHQTFITRDLGVERKISKEIKSVVTAPQIMTKIQPKP